MRVLIINSVCGIGSTGRICTDLYAEIKKEGYQCKIAYGRNQAMNIDQADTIKIGTDFDTKCHVLMNRITDKHGFYSKKATKEFINKVKAYDPDIIHLHNIHGYYINIEELFKYLKNSGKKVVWTLHDCWSFTGHCAHYTEENCYRWKRECNNCPLQKTYPKAIIMDNSKSNYLNKKRIFNSCSLNITTVSNWLGNEVKKSFLKNHNIDVIVNGVDLHNFQPTDSNFRVKNQLVDKKIILGVSSVWNNKKGLQDFITLSKQLSDDYQIVLVGVTDKIQRQLPKNILGINKTNNVKELAEIYSASDVYFNASAEETFGMTTVESIACGTPVIGYDSTAVPEIITKNIGYVVEKRDLEAVKDRIINICENQPFEKENLLKEAIKYDKKNIYKEYIELYENLIQ